MNSSALFLLLFCLMSGALTAQQAAEPKQSGDFTYTSDGSAVTITGYTGKGNTMTIPEKIASFPVQTIGSRAFASTKLTSVTISSGITEIASHAFIWCELSSITIPPTVTSIGGQAFYQCINLASITVPASVTSIGEAAFAGCAALTNVTIPSNTTSIGSGAFSGCENLSIITVDAANPAYRSVDAVLLNSNQTELIQYPAKSKMPIYAIPNGVTKIGDRAFSACMALTSIVIPSTVTSIGDYAFGSCKNLTNATFKGNAPSIGENAFNKESPNLAIRYYKGATGFTTPEWNGYKTIEIDPATELLDWTSNDGKTIKADFLKLDGEAVVVRLESGKETKISFTRLSPESVARAKALAQAAGGG